jgi:rare lipoprotein A
LRSTPPRRKTRRMYVAIATIILAVPASALALTVAVSDTQAATPGAPLQATVSPRQLSVNHSVTVTGTAPASDAGQQATVQTALSPQGTWRSLTSTTIGAGGRFRARAKLRSSGYLRVIEAPAATAAATAGRTPATPAAPSSPTPVVVHAQFRIARRSLNLIGGRSAVVSGHLVPARSGQPVELQARSGRRWLTLSTGRTGGRGGFGLRVKVDSGTQRGLRVVFPGDRANARTVKPAGNVTVFYQDEASWYNDGGNTACGFHAAYGVANRTLPCGTKVRFDYGGRTVTATVDDRGPYVGGRNWDLNQNTAAALGFGGVGAVWVSQ